MSGPREVRLRRERLSACVTLADDARMLSIAEPLEHVGGHLVARLRSHVMALADAETISYPADTRESALRDFYRWCRTRRSRWVRRLGARLERRRPVRMVHQEAVAFLPGAARYLTPDERPVLVAWVERWKPGGGRAS